MPRKAPDNVQEMRVTFGTYERQFAKEVKTDIETGVKVAAISAVALPLVVGASAVAGLGLLGYGIYAGLNTFSLMDFSNPITGWREKLIQDNGSYAGFILRGFMSVAEYNAIQEGGGGGDF